MPLDITKPAQMLPLTISAASFGQLPDGSTAQLFTLENRGGIKVCISDFGGIITQILAPDRHGGLADIVLGYDTLADYVADRAFFGATIGRFGNRIANGRFAIDGETHQLAQNDGAHHLHGGPQGFHKTKWDAYTMNLPGAVALVLRHVSPDGDQGYPGQLSATITYQINADNELRVRYHAITDKPTPVNLTQHTYFNLAGQGTILNQELTIHADHYTPIDQTLIPLGMHMPVSGTPFDFRASRTIGERIADVHEQLNHGSGYDHNFVLNSALHAGYRPAARLFDRASGRVLELVTQEPGLQFYSGNFLDDTLSGKGRRYPYRGGLCLEPQHFPDSPNHPTFPDTILRPGKEYRSESIYRFSTDT